MEEEISMISNVAATNPKSEASDSSSSNYASNTKRHRHDGTPPASRFKGVVVQHNGHWGAQIYANHQRIWLGTFKSENEAAAAYDSAAIKLRSGDAHRNFPWTDITALEPSFQREFTTDTILNMIKYGSYPIKFAEFLTLQLKREKTDGGSSRTPPISGDGEVLCRRLFQKELTPSDVGKLNRLVIPKKCAVKYFPRISDVGAGENLVDKEVDDVQLVFYDRSMRSWKFRYCYWKSSQSFVFTRGWNRFVKEKRLKAKDSVIFSLYECQDRSNDARILHMIDVGYHDAENNRNNTAMENENGEVGMPEFDFRQGGDRIEAAEETEVEYMDVEEEGEGEEEKEEKEVVGVETVDVARRGFRLFGVQII